MAISKDLSQVDKSSAPQTKPLLLMVLPWFIPVAIWIVIISDLFFIDFCMDIVGLGAGCGGQSSQFEAILFFILIVSWPFTLIYIPVVSYYFGRKNKSSGTNILICTIIGYALILIVAGIWLEFGSGEYTARLKEYLSTNFYITEAPRDDIPK